MASALSGSEKKDNFQKLSRLLIDGGTKSLRNYFSSFHPPTTLTASLNAHKSTLTGLKGKVLKPPQWDILFPKSGPPTTAEDYDITLLTCLLRNICGLAPPASTTSWDKLPPATDQTKVAQVVRLRHYRNDLYAHIKTTEVETADFNHYWADISAALLSLGGISKVEVDDLYVAPLGEMDYGKLLKEWWKQDIDLAEKIEGAKEEIISTSEKNTEKILSAIASQSPSRKIESKDAATITEEDKAASMRPSLASEDMELPKKKVITHFIECLCEKYTTGEMALIEPLENLEEHDFSLDSMFTEPKIVRKETDLEVKMNSMFVVDGKVKEACKVLLEGDSGAGKTTLTKKLASDWAKGVLSGSSTFPEVELLLVLKCSEMKEGNEGGGIFQAIQEQLLPEEITVEERLVIFEYIKHNQGKFAMTKNISKFSHGSEGAAMSINPMAEFTSRDPVDDDFDEFRQQHDKVYEDDSEHRRRKHIFRHNVRYIRSMNRRSLPYKLEPNHFADLTDDEFKSYKGELDDESNDVKKDRDDVIDDDVMDYDVNDETQEDEEDEPSDGYHGDNKDYEGWRSPRSGYRRSGISGESHENRKNKKKEHKKRMHAKIKRSKRMFEVPDQLDWRDYGAVNPAKGQGTCGSCWAFATAGAVEVAHFIQNSSYSTARGLRPECIMGITVA